MQYTKTFLTHPKGNDQLRQEKGSSLIGLSIPQDYNNPHLNYYTPLKQSYPIVQLSENRLLVYAYSENRRTKEQDHLITEKAQQSKKFTGFMSNRTHAKISEIVNSWVKAGEDFKKANRNNRKVQKPIFTFITLTLPSEQKHTDKELKRLALNRYLIWMFRKTEIKNYMWKAERQKNGNLHFHILADSYIPWEAIKIEWNSIMSDLGYIEPFFAEHGHKEPNSTDIHKLKSVKNPAAYIAKYFSKSEEGQAIDGRIWSSSRALKQIKKFEFEPDWRFWALLQILLKKEGVYKNQSEYCTIIQGDIISEIKQYLRDEYEDLKKKRFEDWLFLAGQDPISPPV